MGMGTGAFEHGGAETGVCYAMKLKRMGKALMGSYIKIGWR